MDSSPNGLARHAQSTQYGYLPAVDGLRFFAFLAVFFHHVISADPLLRGAAYGWVGVEVFFAISSYLFFTLFEAEHARRGAIDIPGFFLRRLLRIYPLMLLLPLAMMIYFGKDGPYAIGRLLGLATLTDNFATAIVGYNTAIPFSGHLWTLSYELQIYLLIPPAFLAYKVLGRDRFLLLLAGVWVASFAARGAFILMETKHPVIWVTPFLRPESTLAGIAIALGITSRISTVVVVAACAAAFALLAINPNVQEIGLWTLAIYPVCAVISGSALIFVTRPSIVGRLAALGPISYLGRISFGLYVYHLFGIYLAVGALRLVGAAPDDVVLDDALRFATALLITVTIASFSWFTYELFFRRIRRRLLAS
jgi:peptidoglycan/LPS O-acetylase OafA/YrhL